MKVDGINMALQFSQKPRIAEPPVMDVNEMKSILYLGLKGNVKIESNENHKVDTFA